jgi:hypothetical protein
MKSCSTIACHARPRTFDSPPPNQSLKEYGRAGFYSPTPRDEVAGSARRELKAIFQAPVRIPPSHQSHRQFNGFNPGGHAPRSTASGRRHPLTARLAVTPLLEGLEIEGRLRSAYDISCAWKGRRSTANSPPTPRDSGQRCCMRCSSGASSRWFR